MFTKVIPGKICAYDPSWWLESDITLFMNMTYCHKRFLWISCSVVRRDNERNLHEIFWAHLLFGTLLSNSSSLKPRRITICSQNESFQFYSKSCNFWRVLRRYNNLKCSTKTAESFRLNNLTIHPIDGINLLHIPKALRRRVGKVDNL